MTLEQLRSEAESLGFKLRPLSGRERIIVALRGGPMSAKGLAMHLDISADTAKVYCSSMKALGFLEYFRGKYVLVKDSFHGLQEEKVDYRCTANGKTWEEKLTETWAARKARLAAERAVR